MSKEYNFEEELKKVRELPAASQKKAFDAILNEIDGKSTDKEIATALKQTIHWMAMLG